MRPGIASLILAGTLASAALAPSRADEAARSLELAHSRASFTVSHLYLTHVTGTVAIVAASVTLEPGSTTPSKVTATLDPKRIDTHNRDRDDDLQGPDWFDVKRFPTWDFTSTAIVPGPSGAFTIQGILTVHGVGRPIALDVRTTGALPDPSYHAVGHVDRHSFGMSVTPTDALIGGDVEIDLDVQLAPSGGSGR